MYKTCHWFWEILICHLECLSCDHVINDLKFIISEVKPQQEEIPFMASWEKHCDFFCKKKKIHNTRHEYLSQVAFKVMNVILVYDFMSV